MKSESLTAVEKEVFAALRRLGWTMPVTTTEVERAEQELEQHPVTLPDSLRNPDSVFQRLHNPEPANNGDTSSLNDCEQNLARAAREGGNISPETEQQMQRDRDTAERTKGKCQ